MIVSTAVSAMADEVARSMNAVTRTVSFHHVILNTAFLRFNEQGIFPCCFLLIMAHEPYPNLKPSAAPPLRLVKTAVFLYNNRGVKKCIMIRKFCPASGNVSLR